MLIKEANLVAHDFPDLSPYFPALPLQRKELPPAQRIEFDRKGVALWNTCCKLGGDDASQQTLANLAKGATLDRATVLL